MSYSQHLFLVQLTSFNAAAVFVEKEKQSRFFITPEALGITDYRGFFAENHIYVNYASKTMYFYTYTLLFPYCLLKLKVTRLLITVSLKLKKWLIQDTKRARTPIQFKTLAVQFTRRSFVLGICLCFSWKFSNLFRISVIPQSYIWMGCWIVYVV